MPGQKQKYAWNLSQFDFEPGERVLVMALWFMAFGGTVPLGNMIFGPVIDAIGARWVLLGGAAWALFLAWWCDIARLDEEGYLFITGRKKDMIIMAGEKVFPREIEEALKRIEKGSYGVCELTGKNIPKARLEAIPWTRVCITCKQKQSA